MTTFNNFEQHSKNYEELFETSLFSDAIISVGDEKIAVHKAILCAHNSSFANVFSECSELNEFTIPEKDMQNFKIFLKYLYTSKVDTKDMTSGLLVIANKYVDESLKNSCDNHLSSGLNKENCTEMLILAVKCDCEKLKTAAADFIAKAYSEICNSENFDLVVENKLAIRAVLNSLYMLHKKNTGSSFQQGGTSYSTYAITPTFAMLNVGPKNPSTGFPFPL